MSVAGKACFASAEDASRLRDALGVSLPPGLPAAFTEPVNDPLGDLLHRFARTNGPFLTEQVVRHLGIDATRASAGLAELERRGRIVRGEFRPDGVEREWCHGDVLRVLRRRSLAALRAEVEPVEQDVLARFQRDWQLVGSNRRGIDGLADVINVLQGASLPASSLERDILPARMASYQPSDLDTLLTAGELIWIGAGSLGTGDGRIRLVWRDQAHVFLPLVGDGPEGAVHEAIRSCLAQRGAVFWADLVAAAAAAGTEYDDQTVLTALWDLVWAGEVTNDALTPLRAVVAGALPSKSGRATRSSRRPSMRSLSRVGPPAATGRWSLVAPLLEPQPSQTERTTASALQFLERYGVVTREMALAEGAEGGFAGVYPVLKELEERGQVRRGYFVAGLGAAQFALPGAVDRLRDLRPRLDHEKGEAVVLSASDPAQPYGAALSWPQSAGRPSRSAGAYVVLRDGEALAFLERGGRSIALFPASDDDDTWAEALASLVRSGRVKGIEVQKINGAPTGEHPEAKASLLGAGFKAGYKGPTLRR